LISKEFFFFTRFLSLFGDKKCGFQPGFLLFSRRVISNGLQAIDLIGFL